VGPLRVIRTMQSSVSGKQGSTKPTGLSEWNGHPRHETKAHDQGRDKVPQVRHIVYARL
jgi:hypothetical protein